MLKKLKIKNLAIVKDLEIDFSNSFNVITGESGSGKTIVYKSITYLLGQTFKKKDLRKDEHKCEIEGFIEINNNSYRFSRIFTSSTTKNFVNEKQVNLTQYRDIIKDYWESYGQHEQQMLVDENNHIKYLDLFSGLDDSFEKYSNLFSDYLKIKGDISTLLNDSEDYAKNKDLYEFQLKELDDFDVEIDEDLELQDNINVLKANKEKYETMNNFSSINIHKEESFYIMNKCMKSLSMMPEQSESSSNLMSRMESIVSEFEDLQYEVSNFSKEFEYNHFDLENSKNKLVKINELKRKYGGTIESIIEYKNKLNLLMNSSQDLETIIKNKLENQNSMEKELKMMADYMYKKRLESSRKLENNITNDLESMGMKGIDFSINLGDVELNKNGLTYCMFQIRTNKGEDLKNLGEIVSGGELSRIMMAIKLSINSSAENKLFVLDEIDAGLSGKEADSIGSLIKKISSNNQVICITHLSQIASKSNFHYKVNKRVADNRTYCEVEKLSEASKVQELAAMISGKNITEESIVYAKEILGK